MFRKYIKILLCLLTGVGITFIWTFTFFRSALCVASEIMQSYIAQMGLFFMAMFFPHLSGLTKQFDTH